jgi:hypothetical protein
MKKIRIILRNEAHKIYIVTYENVHSLGIVEEEGTQCIRVYMEDFAGGETATYELDEILSIEIL